MNLTSCKSIIGLRRLFVNSLHQKKRKDDKEMKTTPFQKISEACKTTGLSQYFLRKGCKDGTVPHIRSGNVYMVNIPALLRQLDAEEAAQ